MSKGEQALVGQTISKVEIASDRKAIRFTMSDKEIIAKCDGDCCSSTWIESVELPAGGFPAKVLEIGELNLPSDQDDDGDVTQFYGLKLVTDKGDLVLDYRNSSNGYYGGNLSWPDDGYFYGGVYGQNVSNEEWEEIKE